MLVSLTHLLFFVSRISCSALYVFDLEKIGINSEMVGNVTAKGELIAAEVTVSQSGICKLLKKFFQALSNMMAGFGITPIPCTFYLIIAYPLDQGVSVNSGVASMK